MRVIAGTYRSRPLVAPKGLKTRPTSDRLRETLFNVLAPRVPGCRFADLYAGSGAVGVEALSRGAQHVYFAETAAPALAAIRANLASLGIAAGFTLSGRSATSLLQALAESANLAAPIDIVFLDPPYEAAEEYESTLSFLGSRGALGKVLREHSIVVAEHSKKLPLAASYGALLRTRVLEQGDAALSFFSTAD